MRLSKIFLVCLIVVLMPRMASAYENSDAYIVDESYGYSEDAADSADYISTEEDSAVCKSIFDQGLSDRIAEILEEVDAIYRELLEFKQAHELKVLTYLRSGELSQDEINCLATRFILLSSYFEQIDEMVADYLGLRNIPLEDASTIFNVLDYRAEPCMVDLLIVVNRIDENNEIYNYFFPGANREAVKDALGLE